MIKKKAEIENKDRKSNQMMQILRSWIIIGLGILTYGISKEFMFLTTDNLNDKYKVLWPFLEKQPVNEFPINSSQLGRYKALIKEIWSKGNTSEKNEYQYLKSYGNWNPALEVFHFKKYNKFIYSFEYNRFLKYALWFLAINTIFPLSFLLKFFITNI